MIKILVELKDNKLYFQIKKRLNEDQKNLMNTNIISKNSLVFSDEYLLSNLKIVKPFFKELINTSKVDTIIIKESDIAYLVLNILKNIPNINKLFLLEETILTYKLCSSIINTKTINYVSLYNLPSYLLEMLDKENIIVESRCEMLFISDFMNYNKIEKYSDIYYKKDIIINFPLGNQDMEDLISFIKINKYLKRIYINDINKKYIEDLLYVLNKNKINNIKIFINKNINDIESINYLKALNKRYKTINYKINYSKEYVQNNMLSHLTSKVIKSCLLLCIIIILGYFIFIMVNGIIKNNNDYEIKNTINNTIKEYKENNYNNLPIVENNELEIVNKDIYALKSINEEVVAWLKVNNTTIDYPVLQHTDNDYYLTHNINNKKDESGWIYMDYRADTKDLPSNTIIWGHNIYYSQTMFGTLYKVKNKNWYLNEDNLIISFNTIYETLNYKIFSIYDIKDNNDYLISEFSSKEKFQEYLDKYIERSIYNFNTPVSKDDKILTLTTCSDNGRKRLVVQAVLLDN